jgi:hypothetical protein
VAHEEQLPSEYFLDSHMTLQDFITCWKHKEAAKRFKKARMKDEGRESTYWNSRTAGYRAETVWLRTQTVWLFS